MLGSVASPYTTDKAPDPEVDTPPPSPRLRQTQVKLELYLLAWETRQQT